MRIILVRHGQASHVGRLLAGRAPGTHLDDEGHRQAEQLAAAMVVLEPEAVYSSPVERAMETAAPIAHRLDVQVQVAEGLTEIDYGEWTGADYHEMSDDPAWRQYNSFRSGTRIPGGELMLEAQARVVGELLRMRKRHPGATVVAVSHADTIRAALGFFLGLPVDLLHRLEIDPASISEIELAEWGAKVWKVNG